MFLNYLEWNDLLAAYFFNEEMASREVILFGNVDLFNILGKPYSSDFYDFITKLKNGPDYIHPNFTDISDDHVPEAVKFLNDVCNITDWGFSFFNFISTFCLKIVRDLHKTGVLKNENENSKFCGFGHGCIHCDTRHGQYHNNEE